MGNMKNYIKIVRIITRTQYGTSTADTQQNW